MTTWWRATASQIAALYNAAGSASRCCCIAARSLESPRGAGAGGGSGGVRALPEPYDGGITAGELLVRRNTSTGGVRSDETGGGAGGGSGAGSTRPPGRARGAGAPPRPPPPLPGGGCCRSPTSYAAAASSVSDADRRSAERILACATAERPTATTPGSPRCAPLAAAAACGSALPFWPFFGPAAALAAPAHAAIRASVTGGTRPAAFGTSPAKPDRPAALRWLLPRQCCAKDTSPELSTRHAAQQYTCTRGASEDERAATAQRRAAPASCLGPSSAARVACLRHRSCLCQPAATSSGRRRRSAARPRPRRPRLGWPSHQAVSAGCAAASLPPPPPLPSARARCGSWRAPVAPLLTAVARGGLSIHVRCTYA